MTEFGKVAVAAGLSVLAHVSLFTVLALMPDRSLVSVRDEVPDKPLEVTLEAAVVPDVSGNETPIAMTDDNAIRTQIDPPNLKKAEKAPENPTAVASYNSEATPQKSATTSPVAPTPTPAMDRATLALEPVAPPLPSPAAKTDEEVGIDALGNYGKAVGNAIGVRSEFYQETKRDVLAVGVVRIKFTLDAQGNISEVEVLSNSAAPANAVAAMRAVKEAKIPPIPPELLSQVPGGRTKIVYTFITY